MEDKDKYIIAATGGIFTTFTKQYALIFICVVAGIVFDVITGLIKSKIEGKAWDSKRGTIGFWKKIGLLVALCFGIFMDCFIPVMLGVISINLPFDCPFGLTVGVYIVLNECISICENLYKINPQAIPKWIINLLKNATDKIDKEDHDDDERN